MMLPRIKLSSFNFPLMSLVYPEIYYNCTNNPFGHKRTKDPFAEVLHSLLSESKFQIK